MKKFKYRLETLLKAKQHIEKERQKEHGAALRQVFSQRQSLSQLDQCKEVTFSRQARSMTGNMSVAEMLVYTRYILKLKRHMLAGGELLKALKETEREKRRSLVEASRGRKVYQKLKERRREQFDGDVRMQTGKESDEIALNSFRRKGD